MRVANSSMNFMRVFSILLVLLLIPAFAVAKKTPTVCDELKGKAYGLCNSYCEASDCDWDPNAPGKSDDKPEKPALSEERAEAARKIREYSTKKTNERLILSRL